MQEAPMKAHDSSHSELPVTASEPGPLAVHEVIMRAVRPGRELDFEALIVEFFREAAQQPGVLGSYLVRPIIGSQASQYGILRSFNSADDRDAFYRSELYREWNERVAPLVEGAPQRRHLHGLEAFFPTPAGPPVWKMALLTWLAVNPAVYIFSNLVPMTFGTLPMLAGLLITNVFVVAALTWVLMPILTKLFSGWLKPAP
jgi:antibiotic biosynthesis monooxygenase (ABM) superfamily enzyme